VRHPRRDDVTAPLFPAGTLVPQKPTGVKATDATGRRIVPRAEDALAALSVEEAEDRLTLDWDAPLRHQTFYKAVYRPAVLRANRLTPETRLPAGLKFHALRHTYASLCVAAGIPPLEIAGSWGTPRSPPRSACMRTYSPTTTPTRWLPWVRWANLSPGTWCRCAAL